MKQRQRKPEEASTNYYNGIANRYREIDLDISDPMIMQDVFNRLNPDFWEEPSSCELVMKSLEELLKYAIVEQHLHDTLENLRSSVIRITINNNFPMN